MAAPSLATWPTGPTVGAVPRHGSRDNLPARVAFAGLALVLFAGLVGLLYRGVGRQGPDPDNPPIHEFAGLAGPSTATQVQPAAPARWTDYAEGGAARLAVLLTQEDSDWLGLAHGFKSMGISFRITREVDDALRHRVVLVYPTISGRALAPDELRRLARHPENGGTLIGFGIEGGGLGEVFGFDAAKATRAPRRIRLEEAPVLDDFTGRAERDLPVNSPAKESNVAVLAYGPTSAQVLAKYDEGGAALLHRAVGRGHAYAFGFDLGHLCLKGFNDRQEGLAASYANEYAPVIDTWLRLIRRLHREGEPAAVSIHPVPEGRGLSVVLSHDVDYSRSLENARAYARLERAQGVAATYFVQAKYVRDWNDEIFLDDRAGPILRELLEGGAEIASHSVSHSRVFETFPAGTGREAYPGYRPFVTGKQSAVNASVLGELRVSKFLLETLAPGVAVRSFRPGHLRNPFVLPQALTATGYQFSSAASANNSLTHLPFRLTHGRGTTAPVAAYEFPVTIEDELPPPLPARLEQSLAVADRIARYGGLFMVLIHTDTVGDKLEFQRRLTAALQERGAWFGRLDDLGRWWAARDALAVDGRRTGDELEVIVHGATVAGVAIDLPEGRWQLVTGRGAIGRNGRQLVIDASAEPTRWRLRRLAD